MSANLITPSSSPLRMRWIALGIAREVGDHHRKPVVYFGSFQDVLRRDSVGNIKPTNEWLHKVKWDLVVFDEYHLNCEVSRCGCTDPARSVVS